MPRPDTRIKSVLDNAQIKYKLDDKNLFSFYVTFNDKRQQEVFIESTTDFVGGFETRKITSLGYVSKTPLSADKQNELLGKSVVLPIGSWLIIKLDDGSYVAEFVAKVPAAMDNKQLIDVINFVSLEADEVEKKLAGKDDY